MTEEQKSIYEEAAEEIAAASLDDPEIIVGILQEKFGPLLKAGVSCAFSLDRHGYVDCDVRAVVKLLSAKERI